MSDSADRRRRGTPVFAGLACVLIGAAIGAGAVALADSGEAGASGPRTVHFLFAQSAPRGELRQTGAPDHYRLVLHDVAPDLSFFTDAPVRIWGALPLRRYTGLWRGDFGVDPPNAAILVPGADPSRDLAVVELERARYLPRAGELVYRLRMLPEAEARSRAWNRSVDQRLPADLENPTVFVDALAETDEGINRQVTDTVTQTNVKVVAEAPSMAVSNLLEEMSNSISLAMEHTNQSQGGLREAAVTAESEAVAKIVEQEP